jgi:hypothetical protein
LENSLRAFNKFGNE